MNDLYNGMTLAQIEANLHPNMPEIHRQLYLNNCKEVIANENSGFNWGYNECLRNTNFNLTLFYLTNK